ncbi:hypothetical protein [Tabrizicola sp.]|uniref:hypothetical protein n=1 Tax=Tabrizicola sp. TaxID=2005166 RepID=UPI002736980D|nr:hypothetical protein [Tabrizicola sp.]MDP3196516.1 hypothetical protein [Tabrizicola sp.]
MKLGSLILAACLALPGLAFAQSAVGKAVVGGKTVTLFDDGTWKYSDAVNPSTPAACKDVTPTVQFCGGALGWVTTPPASPEINAAYRIDARHYAQYLIEDLGSDDGLTPEFMRQVVLDNAQMATGNTPEVIDVQPVTLGALTGDTVVYKARINGLDVVFANSVFVQPKRVMQIMTYAIANTYSPQHAAYQADFLSNTKLAE